MDFLEFICTVLRCQSSKCAHSNMSFVKFFVHATLMMIAILSADHAQRKADQFRLSLYEYHHVNSAMEGRTIDSLLIRYLKLTAWGVFHNSKTFVFRVVAWIFTYATVLLQLS
ncbi:hypothetical protein CEXT_237281 [Caerostris extrusa]|uniref:Gustatory receptor n=1 Tax=Caerostris extrusa TaxID=172846 RepID=A0AAV4V1V7_CAEEX|nr:hypothetical protein CEXT_237281 [Caerostris extrusa]